DGRDLGFEEAGELLIRGEPLFSGYWRDPEATAAAFAEGGWYRTGDIGTLTADGYLYILDRAKDVIISGGENIYPAEVAAGLAGAAEQAGFSAVFVAEGHGDALALCHPVAAATRRVRVGTAVANAALRPPVLAAKTAAQLDRAAGGRFILGLGVGNAVMNARFGLSPHQPLRMVEEYVGVVRSVLNRGTGY